MTFINKQNMYIQLAMKLNLRMTQDQKRQERGWIRVPWGPTRRKLSYICTTWLYPGLRGSLLATFTKTNTQIHAKANSHKTFSTQHQRRSKTNLLEEFNLVQGSLRVVPCWFHHLESNIARCPADTRRVWTLPANYGFRWYNSSILCRTPHHTQHGRCQLIRWLWSQFVRGPELASAASLSSFSPIHYRAAILSTFPRYAMISLKETDTEVTSAKWQEASARLIITQAKGQRSIRQEFLTASNNNSDGTTNKIPVTVLLT